MGEDEGRRESMAMKQGAVVYCRPGRLSRQGVLLPLGPSARSGGAAVRRVALGSTAVDIRHNPDLDDLSPGRFPPMGE